tara:strand:+ start:38612 stop:38788 length:177 start_codon:yes stop_codon:yes gene_type:complete
MVEKKYEIIAHEIVEYTYIVDAEDIDEAIDMVREEEYDPVQVENIFNVIDSVKEIKYV